VAAGLGELAQQNPELQTCNYHGIVQGWGCQNHAHRLCVSRGFGTGFNVANYNGSQNTALVCAQAHAVENEFKISEFGDDVRPLAYGTNILGGLAQSALPNGSWLTQGDAIRNDKNVPVVVTQAEVTSSYDGWWFSSDSCFTIGKPTTWQNDPDDEHSGGELMCVYSSEQARPNFNYGRSGRGVVLDPGQTLRFQATPNWGPSGNNHYATAHVTVAPADGYAKMRRMRFPRVDSAYSAGLVQAGCNENCTRVPMSVSEGMNPVSTNKWYVAATHRTIRGITIFTNTAVWGSLRVVQQGGADIRTPYNFEINRDSYSYALGPQAFDESLGAQQTGSAFVPLDIDVPVGALVGIDFYIYEDGGDFAGYVWFE
jgi:hypothetical protein